MNQIKSSAEQSVQKDTRSAVVSYAAQEFQRGLEFSENHWFCRKCGFVEKGTIQVHPEDETVGTCCCGSGIDLHPF